jgi:hypothetical protein
MSVSAFIFDDGYTSNAFIEGQRNLFPHMRIKFRPTTATEQAVIQDEMKDRPGKKPGRATDILSGHVATVIKEWEFLEETGEPIQGAPAVSKDMVLRLQPVLWAKVVGIVFWGDSGGDVDPFIGNGAPMVAPNDQLRDDLKN